VNALERIVGAPMAAPETRAMRRLRFAFTALVSATGLGVLTLDLLVAYLGRAGAGGMLSALIVITTIIGCLFFFRKNQADGRWLLARGFAREDEEA
jgi:hypothetical protein